MRIADWQPRAELRIMAGAMVAPGGGAQPKATAMMNKPGGPAGGQDDTSDFDQQTGQQTMPGATIQDPTLTAAPYVKLLTKLGYEFQGHDQDLNGQKIGSSFTGPDGDTIMVKPDGSWTR